MTIEITYTDGTTSATTVEIKGTDCLGEIDRFKARVRKEIDAYRAMGVRKFTFQITPQYAEVTYLASMA